MAMIHLSAYGLDALQRGFEKAPVYTRQELVNTMKGVAQGLQGQVADAMPDVSGLTRASVTGDAWSTPAGVLGVVGSASIAALVLEQGRKPGKGVSKVGKEAIAEWAVKALGVTPVKAESIAFVIARNIKEKGLPAKKPFQKTLDRHWGDISRDFENCTARIASHLAADVNGGQA